MKFFYITILLFLLNSCFFYNPFQESTYNPYQERKNQTLSVSITPTPGIDQTPIITPVITAIPETETPEITPEVTSTPLIDIMTGLIARWNFEEGSGNVVNDDSGNDLFGVISGAVYSTDRKVGDYSLYFDGIDDNIVIFYDQLFDMTNDAFTICCWTKITEIYRDNYIINKSGCYFLDATRNYVEKSNLYVRREVDSFYNTIQNTNEIQKDVWCFIACTYSSERKKIKIYINGILDKEKDLLEPDNTINKNTSNIEIGSQFAQYYKGYLDDIRLYNRALTEEEINYIFGIN